MLEIFWSGFCDLYAARRNLNLYLLVLAETSSTLPMGCAQTYYSRCSTSRQTASQWQLSSETDESLR